MRRVSLAARRAQRFLRHPPPPRWRRPGMVLAGMLLAAAGLVLAAEHGSRSGAFAVAADRVTAGLLGWSVAMGLGVEEILVEGRHRTPSEELIAHLGIRAGAPLLGVSPARLKARAEDLTWVDRAEVTRVLPGTIRVRISERRPLALWQRDGVIELIDHRGTVIPIAGGPRRLLREWRDLRIVVGDGAAERAARLFAILASEPDLWARVVALTYVGERRWNVRLDQGIDVLLPENGERDAWRELALHARRDDLLERAIRLVDLRLLPDRLLLRLDSDLLARESSA